ncbi:MAG: hypothetical protein GXP62_05175 [Oligoflexia bacterium]|nr:hypothetical protein [Oligoflexia bacterium]
MTPQPAPANVAPVASESASGTFYRAIVRFTRFVVRRFFRRVEVTGLEHLPADGGGILVSWHPNGLIDPLLILAHFPRQVTFGARHGLFKWPILGQLMRAMGAVPIYRGQDSAQMDPAARRQANTRSLDALADRVADGSFSCLFPEGDSHDNPDLLELRTGAARFYFRARELQEDPDKMPVIIPVGLHYDAKNAFRSSVLVSFHPAITVTAENSAESSAQNSAQNSAGQGAPAPTDFRARVRRLTGDIDRALREVVHATESWEIHHLMNRTRKLMRAERAARAGAHLHAPEMTERTLAFSRVWAGYHIKLRSHPEQTAALRTRITEYDRDLIAIRIEDHELDAAPRLVSPWLVGILILQLLLVVIVLPPILIWGVLVNGPPALVLWGLCKVTAKRIKDEATVKVFLGLLVFPLAWLLAGVFGMLAHEALHASYPVVPDYPFTAGLLVAALSILGGMLSLRYLRVVAETARALRVRLTRTRARVALARLRVERAEIHDAVQALIADVDLPGAVTAKGRVVAEEDPDALLP